MLGDQGADLYERPAANDVQKRALGIDELSKAGTKAGKQPIALQKACGVFAGRRVNSPSRGKPICQVCQLLEP